MTHRASAVSYDRLPEYQELRNQANLLKKHTIDHLDFYLELFEKNVLAHGGRGGCTAPTARKWRTSFSRSPKSARRV